MKTLTKRIIRSISLVATMLVMPAVGMAQQNNTFMFLKGDGSSRTPFEVDSYDALVELREFVATSFDNFRETSDPKLYYVKISKDIDLSDDPCWIPIRYYQIGNRQPFGNEEVFGEVRMDGGGYTISNLTIQKTVNADCADEVYLGLFGRNNSNASLQNLNLKNVNIDVTFEEGATTKPAVYAGALAGYVDSPMSDIHVDGNIIIHEEESTSVSSERKICVGGVAGVVSRTADTPENMEANMNITSACHLSSIGGLVGELDNWIRNSVSSGTLQGPTSEYSIDQCLIGGICGKLLTTVGYLRHDGLCSVCKIVGGDCAGGLYGLAEEYFSYSTSSEPLVSVEVRNSFSSGSVYNTKDYAGGIMGGYSKGGNFDTRLTFNSCYSSGTLKSKNAANGKAILGNFNDLYSNTRVDLRLIDCAYDTKMINDPTDYVAVMGYSSEEDLINCLYGVPTEDFLGEGLKNNFVSNVDSWSFEEGKYPQVKTIMNTTIAQLAVTPVLLADGDYADYVYEDARLPLVKANGDDAEWTAPDGNGMVESNNDDFEWLKSNDVGYETLTLSAGGFSKQLHLFMAYSDQAWVGEDNIPTGALEDVFNKGNGTLRNPYVIMNGGQLAYAVKNNKETHYYKLGRDIILNRNLFESNNPVPWIDTKKKTYTWTAKLNGNGKLVHGMYLPCQSTYDHGHQHGLLGSVTGEGKIYDMGLVESLICDDYTQVEQPTFVGTIVGSIGPNASLSNCFTSGNIIIDGVNNVYVGGVAGKVEGTVTDCFNAASVLTNDRMVMIDNNLLGGIAGTVTTGGKLTNCVNIGRVSHFDIDNEYLGGICVSGEATYQNCFYDSQMTACSQTALSGQTALSTKQMTDGTVLANQENWTAVKGTYPMLKSFAGNMYTQLLCQPVILDSDDRSTDVKTIVEMPGGEIKWKQLLGEDKLRLLADYALAEPVGSGTAQLISTLTPAGSSYHAVNSYHFIVGGDMHLGIKFVDPKAEEACVAAFGENGILTLEKALSVTDFTDFCNHHATDEIIEFPEMRFFMGVKELDTQLATCASLTSVTFPKTMESISEEAFEGCTSLKSVTLPTGLTTVKPYAFRNSQVEEILVANDNTHFISHDGVLFIPDSGNEQDKGEVIVAYPPKRDGESYMYTSAVKGILTGAFPENEELTTLYLGDDWGTYISLEKDGIPEDMKVYINDATMSDETAYEEEKGRLIENYEKQDYWCDFAENGMLERYYPLKMTSAKYATMCIFFPTELPKGFVAYYCDRLNEDEGKVMFCELGQKVPAEVPVLIYGPKAGVYPLYKSEDTFEELIPFERYENFEGSGETGYSVGDQSSTSEYSILTLGHNSSGHLGFYGYANKSQVIPPYKAFLALSNLEANMFAICFEESSDGIKTVRRAVDTKAVYDISGRKVAENSDDISRLTRGMYISGGIKFVVK